MDKLYQKYVGYLYVKNFLVIFLALEFFYISVDLLSNLKNLPTSANLQLLYVYYNAQIAVNYILPLSLVFAMIASKLAMIRSNELISLYACGVSKSQVIKPLFIVSMFFTLLLIGLNFTSFVSANEYRENILRHNKVASNSEQLFVKYSNSYVYIDTLDPVRKEATDIKVFETNGTVLEDIIHAKSAEFVKDTWHLKDVDITTLAKEKVLGGTGLKRTHKENLALLKGFKPSIIDSMKEGKVSLDVLQAVDALRFLSAQNSSTTTIKSILYSLVIFPMFAPFMVVILFYFLPLIARFFNLALLSFAFIFATLCVWGVLFVLTKFTANGIMIPELSIMLPIIIMGFYAFRLYIKHR